jgi:hypothetical protein
VDIKFGRLSSINGVKSISLNLGCGWWCGNTSGLFCLLPSLVCKEFGRSWCMTHFLPVAVKQTRIETVATILR